VVRALSAVCHSIPERINRTGEIQVEYHDDTEDSAFYGSNNYRLESYDMFDTSGPGGWHAQAQDVSLNELSTRS